MSLRLATRASWTGRAIPQLRRTYAARGSVLQHSIENAEKQDAQGPPMIVPTSEEVENDPQLAGLGYPQFKGTSRQWRKPYGWWDPQERVNFGETRHQSDETLSMWGPDVHSTPGPYALRAFAIAVAGFASFGTLIYYSMSPRPIAARTYPYGGLVQELSGTTDAQYAARTPSEGEDEEEE
ncbi:uncharacterized protein L969DRAFT_50670 [Mixia osmundae IAM 14324]|uniref:Uncharacterized protein n=1 Tax=Mixia osmundae (strain CBS 9802 / IAM 14324 / JCM 22182 / KY 12970) TaxID=764103 RepID=G7E7M4_MIXOS|nr:uncharacterized protein L969DRAFT_50670 [Mixia osmundae IAM 14324]KEI38434.1 hypothetical protein L969DRAFT_50670 [Mixia osmundae IAM 14324]GAA98834.1 hypothetical protein E5Q_05522 [Mixia osmundae IAM 14324]